MAACRCSALPQPIFFRSASISSEFIAISGAIPCMNEGRLCNDTPHALGRSSVLFLPIFFKSPIILHCIHGFQSCRALHRSETKVSALKQSFTTHF